MPINLPHIQKPIRSQVFGHTSPAVAMSALTQAKFPWYIYRTTPFERSKVGGYFLSDYQFRLVFQR